MSPGVAQHLPEFISSHAHKGHRGFRIDGHANRNAQPEDHRAIMLPEEDEHRLVEHMHVAERRFLGTLAFVVNNPDGHIPVLISPLQYAIREVDILTIHEEILIQQPHLVEHASAYHHERSAHHLYPSRLIPRKVTHVVMAESRMPGITPAQPRHLVECRHRRRQSASRLIGFLTVDLQHLHSCGTSLGVFVHEGNDIGQHLRDIIAVQVCGQLIALFSICCDALRGELCLAHELLFVLVHHGGQCGRIERAVARHAAER